KIRASARVFFYVVARPVLHRLESIRFLPIEVTPTEDIREMEEETDADLVVKRRNRCRPRSKAKKGMLGAEGRHQANLRTVQYIEFLFCCSSDLSKF
ncbi:hypothetical protein, partial [Marinicrinis lubricantis]